MPKPNIEQWLFDGAEYSGQTEIATFCECLQDILEGMRKEGCHAENDIREHLLAVADQFIDVATVFKTEFGGSSLNKPQMTPEDFVSMVARMTTPGSVTCRECGEELEESGTKFECKGCGEVWPMSKVDEWRFDNAEDNSETLSNLIATAREIEGGSV